MTPAQQPEVRMTQPKKTPFDDLVYAIGRWEIYRQDAGMGEYDYCVLRNGTFFCRTEVLELAKELCAAYDKTRPRPAPALKFTQNGFTAGYTVEQIAEIDKRIRREKAEAARKAREDVLDMLDEWLLHYENNSMYKWEVQQRIKLVRDLCEQEQPQ